jgi:hypothetical protein
MCVDLARLKANAAISHTRMYLGGLKIVTDLKLMFFGTEDEVTSTGIVAEKSSSIFRKRP